MSSHPGSMALRKGPAIGIDLGTWKCCVGVVRDGKVEIIKNERGSKTTPSYVAFTETERLVGEDAKDQVALNPANTVFGVKRIIGRRFDDPLVKTNLGNFPFTTKQVCGSERTEIRVQYRRQSKWLPPEHLTAMLLRKMKLIAETYLGCSVEEAVVSIPACFNSVQRQATLDAAEIAGLKVLQLLHEPTAVALAFKDQAGRGALGQTVMVVDAGGGTLQAAVASLKDGLVDVKAVSGNAQFGGCDLDQLLVDDCVEKVKINHKIDLTKNKKALERLRVACHKAKCDLTLLPHTTVQVDSLERNTDFMLPINRKEFYNLFLSRSNNLLTVVVKDALKGARLQMDQIDEVLVVGGSSRIPAIISQLEGLFPGKKLNRCVNIDEAVAHGAALQAALLAEDHSVADTRVSDVTPRDFYLEHANNKKQRGVIFRKNNKIPNSKIWNVSCESNRSQTLHLLEDDAGFKFVKSYKLKFRSAYFYRKNRCEIAIDQNGLLTDFVLPHDELLGVDVTPTGLTGMKTHQLAESSYQRDEQAEVERIEASMKLESTCYKIKSAVKGWQGKYKQQKLMQTYGKKCVGLITSCETVIEWLDNNPRAPKEKITNNMKDLKERFECLSCTVSSFNDINKSEISDMATNCAKRTQQSKNQTPKKDISKPLIATDVRHSSVTTKDQSRSPHNSEFENAVAKVPFPQNGQVRVSSASRPSLKCDGAAKEIARLAQTEDVKPVGPKQAELPSATPGNEKLRESFTGLKETKSDYSFARKQDEVTFAPRSMVEGTIQSSTLGVVAGDVGFEEKNPNTSFKHDSKPSHKRVGGERSSFACNSKRVNEQRAFPSHSMTPNEDNSVTSVIATRKEQHTKGTLGTTLGGSVISPITTTSGSITSSITTPSGSIASSVTITSSSITSPITTTSDSITSPITTTSGSITSPITTASDSITSPITTTSSSITSPITTTSSCITSPITTTSGSITSPITTTSGSITSPVTTTNGSITSPVTTTSGFVTSPSTTKNSSLISPSTTTSDFVVSPRASAPEHSSEIPRLSVITSPNSTRHSKSDNKSMTKQLTGVDFQDKHEKVGPLSAVVQANAIAKELILVRKQLENGQECIEETMIKSPPSHETRNVFGEEMDSCKMNVKKECLWNPDSEYVPNLGIERDGDNGVINRNDVCDGKNLATKIGGEQNAGKRLVAGVYGEVSLSSVLGGREEGRCNSDEHRMRLGDEGRQGKTSAGDEATREANDGEVAKPCRKHPRAAGDVAATNDESQDVNGNKVVVTKKHDQIIQQEGIPKHRSESSDNKNIAQSLQNIPQNSADNRTRSMKSTLEKKEIPTACDNITSQQKRQPLGDGLHPLKAVTARPKQQGQQHQQDNRPALLQSPSHQQQHASRPHGTGQLNASSTHQRKAPAIGIDLGTWKCCVGVVREGKVEIIENERGSKTTPSYVAFTETERLVGEDAKDQVALNPTNTVYGVKRIIGRRFEDKSIQTDMKLWSFTVSPDEHKRPRIPVHYREQTNLLSPELLSAMMLEKMKRIAESHLGCEVRDAVISVPAYFNNSQRQATKDAGAIAGLNVLGLINEPTAAALAYRDNKARVKPHNVLIFDLGGGTFDVAVIRVDESGVKVKGVCGDTEFGGNELDVLLMKHFEGDLRKKCGKSVLRDMKAMERLRIASEKAKKTLTLLPKANVQVDSLLGNIDFNASIKRYDFEQCFDKEAKKKIVAVMTNVLQQAKLQRSNIDEVVLVGGTSRIPKIQSILKEFFAGKALNKTVNPDEAVAHGAALHAALLAGDSKVKEVHLAELVQDPVENYFGPPVATFQKYRENPTDKELRLTTRIRIDTEIQRTTIQGSNETHFIQESVEYYFRLDSFGVFEVYSQSAKCSKDINRIPLAECLSETEATQLADQVCQFAQDDQELKEGVAAMSDLESLCFQSKALVTSNSLRRKLGQDELRGIADCCEEMVCWLDDNDSATKTKYQLKKRELCCSILSVMEKRNAIKEDFYGSEQEWFKEILKSALEMPTQNEPSQQNPAYLPCRETPTPAYKVQPKPFQQPMQPPALHTKQPEQLQHPAQPSPAPINQEQPKLPQQLTPPAHTDQEQLEPPHQSVQPPPALNKQEQPNPPQQTVKPPPSPTKQGQHEQPQQTAKPPPALHEQEQPKSTQQTVKPPPSPTKQGQQEQPQQTAKPPPALHEQEQPKSTQQTVKSPPSPTKQGQHEQPQQTAKPPPALHEQEQPKSTQQTVKSPLSPTKQGQHEQPQQTAKPPPVSNEQEKFKPAQQPAQPPRAQTEEKQPELPQQSTQSLPAPTKQEDLKLSQQPKQQPLEPDNTVLYIFCDPRYAPSHQEKPESARETTPLTQASDCKKTTLQSDDVSNQQGEENSTDDRASVKEDGQRSSFLNGFGSAEVFSQPTDNVLNPPNLEIMFSTSDHFHTRPQDLYSQLFWSQPDGSDRVNPFPPNTQQDVDISFSPLSPDSGICNLSVSDQSPSLSDVPTTAVRTEHLIGSEFTSTSSFDSDISSPRSPDSSAQTNFLETRRASLSVGSQSSEASHSGSGSHMLQSKLQKIIKKSIGGVDSAQERLKAGLTNGFGMSDVSNSSYKNNNSGIKLTTEKIDNLALWEAELNKGLDALERDA